MINLLFYIIFSYSIDRDFFSKPTASNSSKQQEADGVIEDIM
jgi:hypothetical protein